VGEENNIGYGLLLQDFSSNNIFFGNSIVNNSQEGVRMEYWCIDNIFMENMISENNYGAYLLDNCDNNLFYHNNFINNTNQVYDECINSWNSTYPTGGNYWSDYSPTCPDLYDGAITPQTTGLPDSICDVQYDIDGDTADFYPLRDPWVGPPPPDTLPPGTISDLAAINPSPNSITLTWTAPGDDGNSGSASGYIVKYSTSGPITDINWSSESTFSQSWSPENAGNLEIHILSGLSQGTTYWFAIKAFDEVPNAGGISNSPNNSTEIPSDSTAPSAVMDLITTETTTDSIILSWTASGDDGDSGTAAGYILKYSISGPINDGNWNSATTYSQSWIPLSAGSIEIQEISGLNPNTTYWFAIRAFDESSNFGNISNSPSETTDEIPASPPDAPFNLQIQAGDSYVELSWNAPTSDGGSAIVGYRIYRGTSPGVLEQIDEIGIDLIFNDTTVINGVTYYYSVSAVNAIGEGTKSDDDGVEATPMDYVNLIPICSISSPSSGDTVSGIVQISGTSSDNDGVVSRVEIRVVDNNWIMVHGTSSWSYDLNTSNLSNGQHTIHIRSYDGKDYSTESSIVVMVDNAVILNQRPVLQITSPSTGIKISGSVNISGTASDMDGLVLKVEIKIDNGNWILVEGTDSWNYILDTTELSNGMNTIYIRSYDGEDYSEETSLILEVDNPSKVKESNMFETMGLWLGIIIIVVIITLLILILFRKRTPPEHVSDGASGEEDLEVGTESIQNSIPSHEKD
jgi:hypothetical protein